MSESALYISVLREVLATCESAYNVEPSQMEAALDRIEGLCRMVLPSAEPLYVPDPAQQSLPF